MISDKFKCIFIHIPKNAGTSIEYKICSEEGLINLLPDHRTVLDMEPFTFKKIIRLYRFDQCFSIMRRAKYYFYRKELGSYYRPTNSLRYNHFFKFSIVRNPWSRAYSWYRGVMRDINEQKKYSVSPSCSFDNFIKYHLDSQPGLRNQCYWLSDSNGNIPMDFIGRFENLKADFSKVAKIIGLKDAELPKKRYTGKSALYIEAFDGVTKDIIWRKYRKEIDFFKFEYGE